MRAPCVVALLMLLGPSVLAQPPPPACEVSPPPIELTDTSSRAGFEVCIRAEVATTLRFDTPLPPDAVVLHGRERFTDVLLGTHSLTVLPAANLQTGERFKVEVRFADGSAPTRAIFWLVAHPGVATHQVNVLRHGRTVEDFQRELQEERDKSERLAQDLERIRAELEPGGFTGLIVRGWVSVVGKGVHAKALTEQVIRASTNALRVERVDSYRAEHVEGQKARVALAVDLKNPGGPAWVMKGAVLLCLQREERTVSTLWQSAPLTPDAGPPGRIVVEWELPVVETQDACTLKLWDESGGRLVTLGHVSFP